MTPLTGTYWACPVKKDARDFEIIDNTLVYLAGKNGVQKIGNIRLGEGSWTFIATAKDITEEQAKEIVERYIYSGRMSYYAYKDYSGKKPQSEDDIITDPLESFRSLLAAKNLNEGSWAILKLEK